MTAKMTAKYNKNTDYSFSRVVRFCDKCGENWYKDKRSKYCKIDGCCGLLSNSVNDKFRQSKTPLPENIIHSEDKLYMIKNPDDNRYKPHDVKVVGVWYLDDDNLHETANLVTDYYVCQNTHLGDKCWCFKDIGNETRRNIEKLGNRKMIPGFPKSTAKFAINNDLYYINPPM
jgi:hypothetical protein